VVTEVACRFRVPFKYDDEVVIRTSVEAAASRSIRFAYELHSGIADTVHATGHSHHVWVNRVTRKPVKADADVMRAFAPFV